MTGVVPATAGDIPFVTLDQVDDPVEKWNSGRLNLDRHIAACRHFGRMPNEPEACDVRAGVNDIPRYLPQRIRGRTVQREHGGDGRVDGRRRSAAELQGCRDD